MNRYDRDTHHGRPRYDDRFRAGGPRGAYDRGAYDRGYGQGRPQERPYSGRSGSLRAGDRTFWGTEPGRELTRGYSDYSPHGRFGGYFGAWDLRPMMAGYDAEMRTRRRGPSGRGR